MLIVCHNIISCDKKERKWMNEDMCCCFLCRGATDATKNPNSIDNSHALWMKCKVLSFVFGYWILNETLSYAKRRRKKRCHRLNEKKNLHVKYSTNAKRTLINKQIWHEFYWFEVLLLFSYLINDDSRNFQWIRTGFYKKKR